MKDKRASLIRLINNLYRCTQVYTDDALAKFRLTSGTYPFLLKLYTNEGVCQNRLCRELNVDKAMSARAIGKLVELGYVTKEASGEDSRAYKLYLTEKAKAIVPEIKNEIQKWIDIIAEDTDNQESDAAVDFLSKALENAKKYKTSIRERSE